jgi:hypothetical protein
LFKKNIQINTEDKFITRIYNSKPPKNILTILEGTFGVFLIMTDCNSILNMSHNFTSDTVAPWIDDEVVPMDVYTACSLGDYAIVREFLKSDSKKVAVNKINRGGWTPLMYAAYVGHDTIVTLLLENQVNVDVRTSNKAATALMLAASCGNEAVVYFLLSSGADINAMDKNGYTALFYAVLQGHQNIVKMLIDSNADMEKRYV